MPLVIESYDNPHTKISSLLFPGKEFQYIERPISDSSETNFYYTRKEDDPAMIKYYFNKIYYIEMEKIVCIDKRAQKIKFYDLKTGKLIALDQKTEEPVQVSKTDFLPQLQAQNGEVIVFPDQDEDDEL